MPAEAAALEMFSDVQCREHFLGRSQVPSAGKALLQQGYHPILYPKGYQETRNAENHKDRLEKRKQMLFRSLETPPFSPQVRNLFLHTKGFLVFRSLRMDG